MISPVTPESGEAYLTLQNVFKAAGDPGELTYAGYRWTQIRDGDHNKYVISGQATAFDSRYTSTTMP